ncbi:MAG: zinc-binding dehydrogenase [Planctomycetes bacterium]|nr:zinc-binding dehydrogenase [Planctomycetota bacterium]
MKRRRDARPTTAVGRSAVVAGPRGVRIEEREFPPPGPGQLRLRMHGCGVCGSNLPVWEGRPWFEYPQAPGAPGHEGWGVVDAVGEGVSGFRPGDRVTALTYHAFADYDYADAGAVVKLPPSLAEAPVPGEPLACAVNVFRRCEIEAGQTVAVVGVGFLGALLVQQAVEAGARVIALSRRPYALEVARKCGAEVALSSESAEATQQVSEFTGGEGCERVIEAVGVQASLDLASSLVRARGKLIIAGFHQDGPRQVNMQDWNWRGIDVINAHERDPAVYTDGMQKAVDALAAGRLRFGELGIRHFALDEFAEALECAVGRPEGFLKSLIWMEDRRLA